MKHVLVASAHLHSYLFSIQASITIGEIRFLILIIKKFFRPHTCLSIILRGTLFYCRSINVSVSRRNLAYFSCGTGNPIDDCWRCDPNWEKNRKRLADCAIGFGRHAIGGRDGKLYVVTDPSDHSMNPKPGTLRHAVIQEEPLWIIFKHDMVIKLEMDILMNSYKTIDGRGANVHIAGGPCIKVHHKTNIIIHGIHIHDCKRGGSGYVSVSPNQRAWKGRSDGDGITIFGGSHIWVDHCFLSSCFDGLIDVVHGSTAITISNNYMTHHNKVMLLGHSDSYTDDKNMQKTVAFNHFGEGLGGRMPRCRFGYFHVVNNDYTHWQHYAIGGSSSPTIFSQGNRFLAPDDEDHKEVTKHFSSSKSEWRKWNWRSEGDLMLNGAFFTPSGAGAASTYQRASSMTTTYACAFNHSWGWSTKVQKGLSMLLAANILCTDKIFVFGFSLNEVKQTFQVLPS